MSRHGPKEIERIKRIAARMTPSSQAQGSLAEPSGSASDLPGCIRRELEKMRAQNERFGLPPGDPECNEAIAFMRWAKRLSGDDLSSTILTVMDHCVRDRTCLAAKLAEAARRLRQNNQAQRPALGGKDKRE